MVRRQHGVIAHAQLLAAGFSRDAIRHRLAVGRLHPLFRGVYAVGRPQTSREGCWMAAVLRCGPEAVLSHFSAAEAWEMTDTSAHPIDVSVAATRYPREPRLRLHRRSVLPASELTRRFGIPTTSPALTLVDLAAELSEQRIERALDQAVGNGLTDPDALRRHLSSMPPFPGVGALRRLIDREAFCLTESHLERLFLPLATRAGLPPPETQAHVNGHRVDFFWPDLGLVVEADSLRWHRTAPAQARDAARDQDHARAGLTSLRFTHFQVRREPGRVQATLRDVAARLRLS